MSTELDVRDVTLVDVSMRDGLQDEPVIVSLEDKAAIASALVAAGFRSIEATSFVHPMWVPQLSDSDELVARLPKGPRYAALVLNMRGYERAVAAFDRAGFAGGEYDLVFVVSASPRHAMANNNRPINASLAIFEEIATEASADRTSLRATVACAFGSPWADETASPDDVARIVDRFSSGGTRTVTLADTVGLALPGDIAKVLERVRDLGLTDTRLALHLHDRTGLALENIDVGLSFGVEMFEGALAGLGGCPFAPDAPGNVDLVRVDAHLRSHKITTGIDPTLLPNVVARIRQALANARALTATVGNNREGRH
jgi:hydroxymethylglutaryl-CoA lyase